MPGIIVERPKMTLQMHENLKKYILRERRKKKEEDIAHEEKRKEELRKAEMNSQTLEQNEEHLRQLQLKLEDLQLKKRDLFNQLKKVLNEETTLKKRPNPAPAEQLVFQPPPYQVMIPQHLKFLSPNGQISMFKPEPQLIQTPQSSQILKRQRSPSPTVIPVQQQINSPVAPQAIYQSPQHQNLLSSALTTLPPVTGSTQSNVYQHAFSPNKRSKMTPQTITPQQQQQQQQQHQSQQQTQNSAIITPTITTYSPVIVSSPHQQQQRIQMPYSVPPQSAFSAYANPLFGNQLVFKQQQQQQQQQQKTALMSVGNNLVTQIHPSQGPLAYNIMPRLPQTSITNQIDPSTTTVAGQKNVFQTQIIAHPQSGGILTGFPIQRPPTQPPF